jgi:hypothetical protein
MAPWSYWWILILRAQIKLRIASFSAESQYLDFHIAKCDISVWEVASMCSYFTKLAKEHSSQQINSVKEPS